ncbi:PXMP2/4 family protein 2 [Gracilariopsis chorda]|uniref:PXMP2/4 family protein 2 n=1 Tax=Gracilariopsis chorda TaxID=448386 RepID=A0A2V3J0E7_9FLOR|nr:PXMP2/4 family protein 2 [Gracilariopsis chorda]|eukprot:PXF47874.1 PXMP2/4 family protein 2 [Gracilariopsis chorda]
MWVSTPWRLRMAFSAAPVQLYQCFYRTPSSGNLEARVRFCAYSLSSLRRRSTVQCSNLHYRIQQGGTHVFDTTRSPTRRTVTAFDKIPKQLPDWWEEEDDDDDEEDDMRSEDTNSEMAYESGGGGNGGNRGGERDGKPEDGSDGQKAGWLATLFAMYAGALVRTPLRTKAITTSALAFIGDLLAQKLSQADEKEYSWDKRRSLSISLWGLVFMGPVLHYWYLTLDRLFRHKYAIFTKLLSDQLVFAPCFNAAFMLGIGALEGNSLKDIADNIKAKLWPVMKANWTLWPAAQVVNFSIVPKDFQVIYVNCVALIWNVIFTYISHSANEEVEKLAQNS